MRPYNDSDLSGLKSSIYDHRLDEDNPIVIDVLTGKKTITVDNESDNSVLTLMIWKIIISLIRKQPTL